MGYDPQLHLKELGTATGVEAFAYMLSDKVFGAMAASKLKDPADLRVGDVVSFDSGSDFGVVVSVDRNDFTYVTCDNSGWITWKETADLDDLDSRGYCLHPLSHQGLRRRHPEQRRKGH